MAQLGDTIIKGDLNVLGSINNKSLDAYNNRHTIFLQGSGGVDIVVTKRCFDKYVMKVTVCHNNGTKVSESLLGVYKDKVVLNHIVAPPNDFNLTYEFGTGSNDYSQPKIHLSIVQYSSIYVEAPPDTYFYMRDTGIPSRTNEF